LSISYDVFTEAFLNKVTDLDFGALAEFERDEIVEGYMKRAISSFRKICKYDLSTTWDDMLREFEVDIDSGDLEELVDIISEGMVVQWLKPYVYKQENLENLLNSRDFSSYSPAELLLRVSGVYKDAKRDFRNAMLNYFYIEVCCK
jgi:hypothetical protein